MTRKAVVPVVPVVLIAAGVIALIGCIPIPGDFKQPNGRPRPESHFGTLNSDKPLKVGGSTVAQVTDLLGPPPIVSHDRSSALVYSYEINGWTTLSDMCFLGQEALHQRRFLLVRFSPDGRVQSYKTYKHLSQLRDDLPGTALDWVAPPGPPHPLD